MTPGVLDVVMLLAGVAFAAGAATGFFVLAGILGLKPSRKAFTSRATARPAMVSSYAESQRTRLPHTG
jgi:hypothetical protein